MSNELQILSRRISRRTFLGAGAAASTLASLPVPAHAADTTGEIELVQKTFKIKDLPAAFEGYKIGFLADLHVSINVPIEWVENALEMLRAQAVDILLLGGDYIAMNDNALSQMLARHRNSELSARPVEEHPALAYTQIAQTVQRLSPPDGAIAVYGNHDRWIAPELCAAILPTGGITVISNEAHIIWRGDAHLLVYGTDDYWNGIPSLRSFALREKLPSQVRVLLTHNPDFGSGLLRKNSTQFDLVLSGHTHGGQIKLPLLGAPFYNIQDLRLAEGEFTDGNGVHYYTTRGVGVIEVPYRINCPAEATVITLAKA